MTKPSTIRQLLSDTEIGLIPYLETKLNTGESHFQFRTSQENRSLVQLGECKTQVIDDKPTLQATQSISVGFLILAPEGLESSVLTAEFQNSLDARILEWGIRTHHSGLLKEPITKVEGTVKYVKNKESNSEKSLDYIAARRTFEIVYLV